MVKSKNFTDETFDTDYILSQVKNIIYHAVKDALKSLQHYEKELSSTEEQRGKECDRVG